MESTQSLFTELKLTGVPDPLRDAKVWFNRPLQAWDGFGFNYVETCQTRDYQANPQDYGGLGGLTDEAKHTIFDAVFGRNGLRPNVSKLFLDPWHKATPTAPYDHRTTTPWMLCFTREGAARMEAQGESFEVVTTLYCPPPWMTRQGTLRGRDFDPTWTEALADYYIDWVRFLIEEERLSVRAVSLHNEGEDWSRWPADGYWPSDDGHDYNMYWPAELVVAFMPVLRAALDAAGFESVAVAPGETTNWRRFHEWGYADAIAENDKALAAMGLITSHGFHAPSVGRWSADYRSAGADILRAKKPELHAWTTSTGWGRQHLALLWEIQQSLVSAKINAFIPWAGVQCPEKWVGGDPNPHTAISLGLNGEVTFNKEYFVYRHACRVGRAGKRVATVSTNDSEVVLFAFTGKEGEDGCVIANLAQEVKPLRLLIDDNESSRARPFSAAMTTLETDWCELGDVTLPAVLNLPPQSTISLVAQ